MIQEEELLTPEAESSRNAGKSPRLGTNRTNLRRSLVSSSVSAAITVPLAFLTVPLILHRLDLTTYGVYSTLASVLSLAGLLEAGVGTEVVRRVAAAHGRDDPAAIRLAVHEGTTILSMLGAVALGAGAVVAFGIPHVIFGRLPFPLAHQVPWVVFAVTLAFAFDLGLSGWLATLTGLQRSDWSNAASLVGILGGNVTTILLVLAGVGIWSLAVGGILTIGISIALRTLGMRRLAPGVPLRIRQVSWPESRLYAGTSSVVIFASVANIIDFQLDKVLLANIVGAASAGAYQIGSSLALQARGLALLPVGVLVPGTAELGDGEDLHRLRSVVTRLNTTASLVLMSGLGLFAPAFVRLWLGPQYQSAAFAAQVLAGALLLNALTGPWYNHCLGTGYFRLPLSTAIANAVVNASVSWTLIGFIGFDGAVYGSLAGNAVGFIVFLLGMKRHQPDYDLSGVAVPVVFVAMLTGLTLLLTGETTFGWPTLIAAMLLWGGILIGISLRAGWLPVGFQRGARGWLRLTA